MHLSSSDWAIYFRRHPRESSPATCHQGAVDRPVFVLGTLPTCVRNDTHIGSSKLSPSGYMGVCVCVRPVCVKTPRPSGTGVAVIVKTVVVAAGLLLGHAQGDSQPWLMSGLDTRSRGAEAITGV